MAHEHALVIVWLNFVAFGLLICPLWSRAAPPAFTKYPLLYIRSFLSVTFDEETRRKLAESAKWMTSGRGYYVQQATRPQTLGYSLADSPIGLLAWIYEKLVDWSDKYPWTDDEGM